MNSKNVLAFVRRHGVVLQSPPRGPVPNLAGLIAGRPIRGSWWAHPKAHEFLDAAQIIRDSPEVLVCKLVAGKISIRAPPTMASVDQSRPALSEGPARQSLG